MLQRAEWERARFTAFHAMRAHFKIKNYRDVCTFKWEKPLLDISKLKAMDNDKRFPSKI